MRSKIPLAILGLLKLILHLSRFIFFYFNFSFLKENYLNMGHIQIENLAQCLKIANTA
jgi:hypothetical protein